MKERKKGLYEKYFKRLFDIIFSFIGLIVLIPIYIFIALLVRIFLGKPVIFKQKRPGKDEKIFTLYKFRTMINKKDKFGNLLPDSERLTKFGRFLRSTSLDELLELWNILKGDMSFVGPRPLLVEYLDKYNDFQKQRHIVRPGLTGLTQINGRNSLSWEKKFKLDIKYVYNLNFITDVKIIFKTIFIVIKKVGISSKNSETMEIFEGIK